jgi:hypothetical protein
MSTELRWVTRSAWPSGYKPIPPILQYRVHNEVDADGFCTAGWSDWRDVSVVEETVEPPPEMPWLVIVDYTKGGRTRLRFETERDAWRCFRGHAATASTTRGLCRIEIRHEPTVKPPTNEPFTVTPHGEKP